jgi:hypothetical protein
MAAGCPLQASAVQGSSPLDSIPAHAWLLDMVQAVVGSSCLIFDMAPSSANGSDMSHFLAAATTRNTVIGCTLSESVHLKPLPDRISTTVHDLNHC